MVLHISAIIQIAGRTCRVRLGHRGRVRCEPGWRLGPDWASRLHDFDLWFVWAGRGSMKLKSGERLRLSPGTGVWMRPGGHYEAEQDPADPLGVSYIHFELLALRRDLPLSGFEPPGEAFHTRHPEFVETLMRRVIELGQEPGGGPAPAAAEHSATGLFAALLAELAREITTRPSRLRGRESRHEGAILPLAARIRETPGLAPGVAEMARQTRLSPDHFTRVFKQVTGLPPESYIIACKMDRARRLLEETDLPVGEIAETLGFQDIYFFSRQFKQKTGWTPTAWRGRA